MSIKKKYFYIPVIMFLSLFFLTCSKPDNKLVLFVAASLYAPFQEINNELGGKLAIDYGGSQALVNKVILGAEPDVLVTAGYDPIRRIKEFDESLIYREYDFLENSVVLVSKKEDKFEGLDQICLGDFTIGIADPDIAPLGKYTMEIMKKFVQCDLSLIRKNLKISQNAMSLKTSLQYGHIDFAFVYRSDLYNLSTLGYKLVFNNDQLFQPIIKYPIVLLNEPDQKLEDDLNELLMFNKSKKAKAIFLKNGFSVID